MPISQPRAEVQRAGERANPRQRGDAKPRVHSEKEGIAGLPNQVRVTYARPPPGWQDARSSTEAAEKISPVAVFAGPIYTWGRTLVARRAFLIRSYGPAWDGLEAILAALPDVTVIGSTMCASDAREHIRRLQPEVIVSGIDLDGASTLPLLAELRSELPTAIIVLFAGRPITEDLATMAAIRVTGFFLWDDLSHPAFPAAHEALRSGAFVIRSRAALASFREIVARRQHTPKVVLTTREREVLARLVTGATDQEIAQQLGIARTTVVTHVRNICIKVGAATRWQAAVLVERLGLCNARPHT